MWHLMSLMLMIILLVPGCGTKDKPVIKQTAMINADTSALSFQLPSPRTTGTMSVEEALSLRRSHRSYTDESITSEDLSQILWAAYGVTKPTSNPNVPGGLRTAPSAGATYPLNIYVLIGKVKGIETGYYRYVPDGHKVIRISDKDLRQDLCSAAFNQEMIKKAPASLFFTATFSRATKRYGDRAIKRYVCMDLGHSAQNVYLQAEALHLGTCAIGAFDDAAVKKVMQVSDEEEALYIMPVGKYFHE